MAANREEHRIMAIALAPRVYGLDAICAATLQAGGGEEAAQFVRRVFARVADKDLAAAPAEQRAAAATALLAFRPPPPARRRQGPGVQSHRRRPRLREPPHDRADRQRRHAVPGQFDHQRVQSPRDLRPSAGPSRTGGTPRPRRRPGGHLGRGRRTGAARIDDAYRDRPPGRPTPARRTRRSIDARAGRGPAGGRGLAADAAGLPRRHRRSRPQPLAEPGRIRRLPALARGQLLHLPGPSPLPLRRRCLPARRPALRADAGLGSRHPAARRGAAVRGRPGRRRGHGPLRARAAQHPDRQDRPSVAGPSQRSDGLRDREDLRRRRPGDRRAALRRPVHVGCLPCAGAGRAAAARPGRRHRAPLRPRRAEPRRQGAAGDPRSLSARRAVPDRGGHALRPCAGHPAAAGTAARGAFCAARCRGPLRHLPGVRAARALRCSPRRPLRRDPRTGVARHGDIGRLLDQQQLGARPVALHPAARGQRHAHARPRRTRARPRRGGDIVERPLPRRPAGEPR